MGWDELTEVDKRVFEYIRTNDFETRKWSTPDASRRLGIAEDDIYESLSNLSKEVKDRIWIHYRDGGIRIVAE